MLSPWIRTITVKKIYNRKYEYNHFWQKFNHEQMYLFMILLLVTKCCFTTYSNHHMVAYCRHCGLHGQAEHWKQLPLPLWSPEVWHCAGQRGRGLQSQHRHLHLPLRWLLSLHCACICVRAWTMCYIQKWRESSVFVSHHPAWEM